VYSPQNVISMSCYMCVLFTTRNTFCGTWYLPHSQLHDKQTVPVIMTGCIVHFHFRSKILSSSSADEVNIRQIPMSIITSSLLCVHSQCDSSMSVIPVAKYLSVRILIIHNITSSFIVVKTERSTLHNNLSCRTATI